MKYFRDILDTITENGIEYINLVRSANILGLFTDVHTESYDITDGDTLDTISYKLYDSIEYWWVVAVVADIDDPFNDIPMTNYSLKKYWEKLVADGEAVDNPTNWNAFVSENNAKRRITVLKPKYLEDLVFAIEEQLKENESGN